MTLLDFWASGLSGCIPFSVLLDRGGRVIATDLRGDRLDRAVEQALAVP